MTQFSYSFKNDIWAIGVIFYTLLTGANPFTSQADSIPHLKRLILDAAYEIPQSNNFISDEAVDLVT
jgi:serine/threonine protein kinase